MSLKVKNIEKIMEEYAPKNLKESYDNVGLMVGNSESEITAILVALDCTLEVIKEAKDKNCNFILTHHPLLFRKPSNITTNTLLGKKIIKLIKNDINLYSSHTNLDVAKNGINDLITEILGYENSIVMERLEENLSFEQYRGIGRMVTLKKPVTLEKLCLQIKNKLNTPQLRYAGNENSLIKKVAIINGSGQDFFSLAKAKGADCIVTGDTTYHYVSDYKEENISIIDAGHFATEWPAVKAVANVLREKLNNEGYKNSVIVSENSKDPYKFK